MRVEQSSSGRHFAGALILFALASLLSLLLLVVALLLWLSGLMGSMIGALLLVGSLFLMLAWALYYFSLASAFRQIGLRLETVYEVACRVERGYQMIHHFLLRWIG